MVVHVLSPLALLTVQIVVAGITVAVKFSIGSLLASLTFMVQLQLWPAEMLAGPVGMVELA